MPVEYYFQGKRCRTATTLTVHYRGEVLAAVGGHLLTKPVALCTHKHRTLAAAESCAAKAKNAKVDGKPLPTGWLSTTTALAQEA